jgi:enoyl-CoA hydratase/carnithine racemase
MEKVNVDIKKGIMTITLNRPEKKNAITVEMYAAMAGAFSDAGDDPGVRAVFITGGSDCFTAGNDLSDFMNVPLEDEKSPVIDFLFNIASFKKPVIAAVAGPAVGIGATMLLHFDLVYASPDARFSFPFVKLGLCPEGASSLLLPGLVGYQKAAELILLAEDFPAEDAREYGIVNGIYEKEDLIERAYEKAIRIAGLPPESIRMAKSLMKERGREEILDTIKREAEEFIERLKSEEAGEAIKAFFEKRPPDFSRFS